MFKACPNCGVLIPIDLDFCDHCLAMQELLDKIEREELESDPTVGPRGGGMIDISMQGSFRKKFIVEVGKCVKKRKEQP